jgi:hypothetical protein
MIYYDVELKANHFPRGSKILRIYNKNITHHKNEGHSYNAFAIPGLIRDDVDFKGLICGEYIIVIPDIEK